MKHLISLVLALLAFQADAATFYYSRCDAGAHASCVAGNDSWDGSAPEYVSGNTGPKLTFPRSFASGNTYRIARGGAWIDQGKVDVYVAGNTPATPVTIESYTPAGCTGDCATQRPIIAFKYVVSDANLTGSGFRFTDGGAADKDAGYVIRGLDIRGDGYQASCNTTSNHVASTRGIYGFNDVDDVLIEDVRVNGFELGIYTSPGSTYNPGANEFNERWTVKNSTICNNKTQGVLITGAPYALFEGNTFDNNGHNLGVDASPNDRDHNVYLAGYGQGMVFRNNTLTRNSIRAAGTCTSVAIVSHGVHPDLTIEGNTIIETATSAACYGMDLNASTGGSTAQDFSRIIIRNNVVALTGAAGLGIGCSSCVNGIIENNTVVITGSTGSTAGIMVPSVAADSLVPGRGDVWDGAAIIRNNSVYIDSTSTGARGISLNPNVTTNTYGETVLGNMVVFSAASSASATCFPYGSGRAAGTFALFDRNICYRPSAPAVWSTVHSTLAAAQAAGLNTNSSTANPTLTATPAAGNGYSMAVNSGSPVINACSSGCSRTARGRYLANSTRDIGSHEFGATVQAPVGPSAGGVQ